MSRGHLLSPFPSMGTGLTAIVIKHTGTQKVTFKTLFRT